MSDITPAEQRERELTTALTRLVDSIERVMNFEPETRVGAAIVNARAVLEAPRQARKADEIVKRWIAGLTMISRLSTALETYMANHACSSEMIAAGCPSRMAAEAALAEARAHAEGT